MQEHNNSCFGWITTIFPIGVIMEYGSLYSTRLIFYTEVALIKVAGRFSPNHANSEFQRVLISLCIESNAFLARFADDVKCPVYVGL